MDTVNIEELISLSPLLEPTSSRNGVDSSLLANGATGGSLYFGTGLTTARAMSVGVPFDVVGMIVVAEKLRRRLGLDRIIQLIADTHALSNEFTDAATISALASQMRDTTARVAQLVGMGEVFTPILASGFHESPDYLEVYNGIKSDDHEYVRREWADIEFLRRQYGLRVKLSWIVDPKTKKIGFDERLYDRRFREVMGQAMSFLYIWAGRTLDRDRQKASPYISIPGERRIMLQPGECVQAKLDEADLTYGEGKLTATHAHLATIVAEFEGLFGTVNGTTTAEKVQSIIDATFA